MKSGICPKCRTTNVYKRKNGISWDVNGNVVIHGVSGFLPDSPVETYVCTSCGFFESYILNAKRLTQIEEKWEKVNSRKV